ncbi:MAG: GTPase ObgE [Deltaproteobacteria bacterium]|nr:GTPase ObgE [Deltaproteobacteria bacterium]
MRFIDEVTVEVIAGRGGNGAVAFRREKYIPFGGPSGGDGGKGGDVLLVGDEGLGTLLDLTYQRRIEADRGESGGNKDMNGRSGRDRMVRVPVGTQVFDAVTGDALGDITKHGEHLLVARGGRGGLGNIHFATSIDRAPRKAQPGEVGEQRELRLELKVLADVGLLGFPNVGKSTFVAAVSAARPKIADYPFTTLTPNLGVVEYAGGTRRGGMNFVVADIPGLIKGASEGAGLGHRFLRHVDRTRALLHLVTLDPGEDREPVADYRALREELAKFDEALAERQEIVALSKCDLPDVREAYPALSERFASELGVELLPFSAATRDGLGAILDRLATLVSDALRPSGGDDSED